MDKYHLDQLVQDVARGDAAAYRRLLEVSAGLVRGYLLSRVASAMRGDVEDIVQETLLAVHLKYNSYNPSLPYLPWLRAIAQHKLVDHWRKRKIAGTVPLEDEMTDVVTSGENANTDTAITLERLMTQLSDKQKKIVQLARIDGKSMTEIADEMNLSVADVKVTLHRALKKLGESVKEEGVYAHG
jgi:RNA polymerase sigma-70 factor (ECF subfamily)